MPSSMTHCCCCSPPWPTAAVLLYDSLLLLPSYDPLSLPSYDSLLLLPSYDSPMTHCCCICAPLLLPMLFMHLVSVLQRSFLRRFRGVVTPIIINNEHHSPCDRDVFEAVAPRRMNIRIILSAIWEPWIEDQFV